MIVHSVLTNLSEILNDVALNNFNSNFTELNNNHSGSFNNTKNSYDYDEVLLLIEDTNRLNEKSNAYSKGVTLLALTIAASAILISCCACCHFSQLPTRRGKWQRRNNLNMIYNCNRRQRRQRLNNNSASKYAIFIF